MEILTRADYEILQPKLPTNGEQRFLFDAFQLFESGGIRSISYEHESFRVGTKKNHVLVPDFFIEYADRSEIVEVKGKIKVFDGDSSFNRTATNIFHRLRVNKFKSAAWFHKDYKYKRRPTYWRMVRLKRGGGGWETTSLAFNGGCVVLKGAVPLHYLP